jgi:thiosulfate/3-mercaptopyruvate sulfurtransferase
MSEMGVSKGSTVVFYDQKGIASSARGWWLMGLFGHDAAAVLDGGLPKWRRESRPIEPGPAAPRPRTTFRASLRAERLRGIGDMMRPDPDRVVIDARAAGRFDGTAPEPRPGLPSGHMPRSRSLPFSELLGPDGTMLPADALRARFAAAGVDGSRPVVTSCGTGVTATILTLGLVQAGLPQGAVYDGSWTEWASRPDTAKETN